MNVSYKYGEIKKIDLAVGDGGDGGDGGDDENVKHISIEHDEYSSNITFEFGNYGDFVSIPREDLKNFFKMGLKMLEQQK